MKTFSLVFSLGIILWIAVSSDTQNEFRRRIEIVKSLINSSCCCSFARSPAQNPIGQWINYVKSFSPLKDFHALLVHLRIVTTFWFAQTLVPCVAQHLTKETLFRIVAQVIWVIHDWCDFEEALQVVHHLDWIRLELLAVDDVELLVCVESEPLLEVLRVLAWIEAAITQVAERLWRRVTGSYHLVKWFYYYNDLSHIHVFILPDKNYNYLLWYHRAHVCADTSCKHVWQAKLK